jgi:hypothetical protein
MLPRGSFATIRAPGQGRKYFECPGCRCLEEPLAIAVGNAGYASLVSHRSLDLADPWYFDPRSDLLAKLIWPAVRDKLETSGTISLETVSLTASFCIRIREASHAM